MFGPFPIARPQFADAINQPGQHTKRYRRELVIPCTTRTCPVTFPPDVEVYSIQDRLSFNTTPLTFIVDCPPNKVCPPGTFPKIITYPPGTFVNPDPQNPGNSFPILIQMQGCQSVVTRVLPGTATQAQIQATQQEVIALIAQQQAECDAVDPEDPDTPNPKPFFSNNTTYSQINCADCEVAVFTGTLPWYITLDQDLNRFVFAAGVLTGITQIGVDAQAQIHIDNYRNFQISNGKLTCVGCTITTASPLTTGTAGTPYTTTIAATGVVGTSVWTVTAGSLPSGLSLNSSTGEISGTPTTGETATFTIQSTSLAQCCSKEFELTIDPLPCGLAANIEYIDSTGVADTGFSATLLEANMMPDAGIGFPGYNINFILDGTPKICEVTVTWGVAQVDNWGVSSQMNSLGNSGAALASQSTTLNDTVQVKTTLVPVYPTFPNGPVMLTVFNAAPVGMGDCNITCVNHCDIDTTPLSSLGWDVPIINLTGVGTASGFSVGSTFHAELASPGPGNGAQIIFVGSMTVPNGKFGLAATLRLTVTSFSGTDNETFLTVGLVTTNGSAQWGISTSNENIITAPGVYDYPVILPQNAAGQIDISVDIQCNAGPGDINITGNLIAL